MINNAFHLAAIDSPVRTLGATIYHYGNVTTAMSAPYSNGTFLKEFTIERTGEDKFFGFGICQKITFKVLDKDREFPTTWGNFRAFMSTNNSNLRIAPTFGLHKATRDEVTNEITFEAYDYIYKTNNLTVADLGLTAPYTYKDVVAAIASKISGTGYAPFSIGYSVEGDIFDTSFPDGANLEGTESLRSVLDDIAEATQTIYFINSQDILTFKKLDKSGAAVYTIDKTKYFDLTSTGNKTLNNIYHVTELGDNVGSATIGSSGITQYVRNNPFWEKVDDIGAVVLEAAAAVEGLTINQFNCSWRGNYLLEPGDKVDLITKDDATVTSYILSDTITYTGGLKEVSSWKWEENEAETPANPATLGEALKQTFAKVDKVNQQIDLVVNDVEANKSSISALQLNTDGITASVAKVEKDLNDRFDNLSENFESLKKEVDLTITPEDVQIQITQALEGGINSVETTTGFTFNEEGLTISKSDNPISTQITEDGMTVYKDATELLVADSEGVKATNLHATTYLIIGTNSRFEDYTNVDGEARTGCFWIGG